jgi:lipoate-protein ligase A
MNLLDLTLPTPVENLALDEALLDSAEAGQGGEVLRFWESPEYFVVVGYANKVDVEVDRAACESKGIPILRRCSGGGTVLQGPGCLNYALILKIEDSPTLQTIPETNCFVMTRQKAALQTLLNDKVEIQGHTDLVVGDLKVSGNAQRRKREFLIFHGTFLLKFDLALMEKVLRKPSKEPAYRNNRSHGAFLANLLLSASQVKAAIQKTWGATKPLGKLPRIEELALKYASRNWNFKL